MNKRQLRFLYSFTIVMLSLVMAMICYICLPDSLKVMKIGGLCSVPKPICLALPLVVSMVFSYLLYKKSDHTVHYFYAAVFGLLMQVINFIINI